MSPRTGRRSRILVVVVVVGCLLLAAVLDRSAASDSSSANNVIALGPRLPSAHAVETAWYCAEGTANPNGIADEKVYISNIDDRAAHARISVMQGPELAPKVLNVDIGAGTLAGVRVADILPIADPGVLVEVTGARAVVTHSITGNNDAGIGPCARDASQQWNFAAGTTVKGAQLFLALLNPFTDDAIVDISFMSDGGPLAPQGLQGFVVPAHSKISVPVHDQARRTNLVGTHVSARRGRVIAEQSQVLDGSDGRKGLTLSLGAPTLSKHWEFANASIVAGRTQTMVIANPASVPTSATIHTRLDGGALEPETVSIPAGTSVAVDLGRRVPPGIGFSVAVDAPVPVVAESFVSVQAPVPSALRGLATAIGSSQAARRWVDAPARVTATSQDSIAVLNPGTSAVTFRITVKRAGSTSTPPTTASVRIAGGKRWVVDLGSIGVPIDGVVIVDASGPVVVDRESSGMPGITIATAIPELER